MILNESNRWNDYMEEVLLYFSLKYNGNFEDIYNALETKEKVNEELKEHLFKGLQCKFTTMVSTDYPERLKHVNYPPFVLFYEGDLSLASKDAVLFAGTKKPSDYIKSMIPEIVEKIDPVNKAIITSLDPGINLLVNAAAMNNHIPTIVVVESDLSNEISQMSIQKKQGLILSECYRSVTCDNRTSAAHNRILAALSSEAIIPETEIESKEFNLVDRLSCQAKDVYCIPPRRGEAQGNRYLIKYGVATPLMDANDTRKELDTIQKNEDIELEYF